MIIRGRKKGSPRVIDPEVREYINKRALESDATREELADHLDDEIESKYGKSPSVETMMRMISHARTHGLKEMDNPWSMGACVQYNIPAERIKDIIAIQKDLMANGKYLTIRRARWIAKLAPVLNLSMYNDEHRLILFEISSLYTRKEQLAEINEQTFADTQKLDKVYVIDGIHNLEASLHEWMIVYLPDIIEDAKKLKKNISSKSVIDSELLLQWKKLLILAASDENKQQEVIEFLRIHPEIAKAAHQWRLFNTRSEMAQEFKTIMIRMVNNGVHQG